MYSTTDSDSYDCLRTAWRLPDHCLMTAWPLPDTCLTTTVWQQRDHYMMTAWQLPDHCLMTAWRLPNDCLTTAWGLPDNCLSIVWQLPDNCLICIFFRLCTQTVSLEDSTLLMLKCRTMVFPMLTVFMSQYIFIYPGNFYSYDNLALIRFKKCLWYFCGLLRAYELYNLPLRTGRFYSNPF